VLAAHKNVYAVDMGGCFRQTACPVVYGVDDAAITNTEGQMKKLVRTALIVGFGLVLMQASAGSAAAAQCMTAGGVGIGVFEGFASFMAEAAMKNSAKARLGTDAPKIGKVDTRCQWKTVNFECHARAQACK
jgi:hypothetical protein